jgi:predicted ester cyclase
MKTQQIDEELKKIQDSGTNEARNIKVVIEFYRLLDEVNLESLIKLLTPTHEFYYQTMDEPVMIDDLKPLIEMFYTAFPDYEHEIESIFATDDKVVARLAYTGTHKNKFMDFEPTGNKFRYKGIFIFQLTDNRISKFWGVEDEMTMMKDLGLELK